MDALASPRFALVPILGQLIPTQWSFATEPTAEVSAVPPLAVGQILQVTLGLIAVLLVIVLSAWLVRRVLRLQPTGDGHLKIIGGVSLGTRERVILLQVGDRQILIGATPGRIQTLHVLDAPPPVSAADDGHTNFVTQLAKSTGEGKAGGRLP